jgi:hypothetical protein
VIWLISQAISIALPKKAIPRVPRGFERPFKAFLKAYSECVWDPS